MIWWRGNRRYYELLRELTLREIKSRYKQSVLGYGWVILNPFFQMIVMAFVFSKLMRVSDWEVPYTIFLYAGLLPWSLFTNSLSSSVNALVGNAGLITKIYFPREVLVLSTLLAKVVDFFLASTVFLVFLIAYKIGFSWYMLWFIPIFFIQFLFTYGLSLVLAAFNLFYRDVQYLVGLIITLWMYLTPVFYAPEILPVKYHFIFKLNPMAIFISAYRTVILDQQHPDIYNLSLGLGLAITMLLGSWFVFKKLEGLFADVV